MNELIGQQIGNYRLTKFLSQEGIIETYLGTHKHLAMKALIKVLAVQLTEEQQKLFYNLTQPLTELAHKNIVRILDCDVQQGRPFLLQDFAGNSSLRSLHPQGSRAILRQVSTYVRQIADALNYMHNRQVVHGDIRPENVLLGWESNILLNNSGLVTLVRAVAPKSTYPPVEVYAYVAPEQFQGQLGPASDQYALAVMVYELLCGEAPFQGTFTEIIAAHLTRQPPALRTKGVEVPADVEQIVMMALAKDPARRFASIQAFANALEQASGSSYTPTSGIFTPTPTPPPFMGSQQYTPTILAAPAHIQQSPLLANNPASVQPTILANDATPTPQTIPASNPIPMPQPAFQAIPATRSGVSRRTMIGALALGGVGLVALAGAGAYAILNFPGLQGSLQSTTHNGNQLVEKLIYTYKGQGQVDYMSWSPDGKRIATSHPDGSTLQIWDAMTGQHVTTYSFAVSSGTYAPYDPAIGSEGFSLGWRENKMYEARPSIDTPDSLIHIIDMASGNEVFTYQGYTTVKHPYGEPINIGYVVWSPNGTMIASTSSATGISVWNSSNGQLISSISLPEGDTGLELTWAPDNQHLAGIVSKGTINVWDISNGQLVCQYNKHQDQYKNGQDSPLINIEWSPNSTRIASYVASGTQGYVGAGIVHVWDARNGMQICTYTSQPDDTILHYKRGYDFNNCLHWSADSKLVACIYNSSVQVWDASNGRRVALRLAKNDRIAWHPQHQYIVSTEKSSTDNQSGGNVYIWDATTGKEIAQLNTYPSPGGLCWSPDGKLLAIAAFDVSGGPGSDFVQIWQIWE